MGHTTTGRGISGTDLVGYVTYLDTVVSLGCLARVPGRPNIRVTRPRLTLLEPQEAVPESSNPPRGGGARFIAWPLSRPCLGECRACLSYDPAPGPTLKKALCNTRPFGVACYKYH